MNFEDFKRQFDEIISNMSTKELMGELIKCGAKLCRTYDTSFMNEDELTLEEVKQEAFEVIGDMYYEDFISREEWNETVDELEECKTSSDVIKLLNFMTQKVQ